METWKWRLGHVDMETWKHGEMETWRHGDMETWRPKELETWKHQTETEAQAIFLNPFTNANQANGSLMVVRLLAKKHTEVICWQTDHMDSPIYAFSACSSHHNICVRAGTTLITAIMTKAHCFRMTR
jgi:hypothetical protein